MQNHNPDIPGSSQSWTLTQGEGTRERICIPDDTSFAITIPGHGPGRSQMCLFIRHKLLPSGAGCWQGGRAGPPRIRRLVPANDKCTGIVTITKRQPRNVTDHLGILYSRLLSFVLLFQNVPLYAGIE